MASSPSTPAASLSGARTRSGSSASRVSTGARSTTVRSGSTFEVITIYGILRLSSQEAPPMAHLQYTDVQDRPTEFLDLTRLTLDEFRPLVRPLRRRSRRIWPRGASMANPGRRASLPSTSTALTHAGKSAVLHPHGPEDVQPPRGPGTPVRHETAQSPSGDSRPLARTPGGPAHPRRCPARSLTALARRLGVTEADVAGGWRSFMPTKKPRPGPPPRGATGQPCPPQIAAYGSSPSTVVTNGVSL